MTMEAILSMWLKPILNININTFDRTIWGVIKWLLGTYGKVTFSMLFKHEDKLKTFNWNPTQPVNIIYRKVEELQDMADTADQPLTDPQVVKYAYIILQKHPSFRDRIKEWNRQPTIQRTWTNFKIHF